MFEVHRINDKIVDMVLYKDPQMLASKIKTCYEALKDLPTTTFFWEFCTKDKDIYAVVLGHSKIDEDHYQPAIKIAKQPINSIMQCDYDIDWQMDEDNATELLLKDTTNFTKLAILLQEEAKTIKTYR